MITRAQATVEPGGRVSRLAGRPPLTLRQVHADQPGIAALCLVGSAAGPLAGDDLMLELDIRPGASARLTATGASIAQGRPTHAAPAVLRTCVNVGPGGRLSAAPPPLVVCAGSGTEVHLTIDLAADAQFSWREMIVLGRHGEPAGAVRVDWDVRRGGAPLLRQSINLSDPALSAWLGMLRGHRVLATQLVVGDPDLQVRTVVRSPDAVAQQLDECSVLLTVLAHDGARAEAELMRLRACLVGGGTQSAPLQPTSSSTDSRPTTCPLPPPNGS